MLKVEKMKCPIFPGTEGFCLREDCQYYHNDTCKYDEIKRVRKAASIEDRKELEKALLKSIRKK